MLASKWKWPNIPGRESFKGPMLHSANWDDSVSLQGKRVGVIGGGSSAVQIVPNLQPGQSSNNATASRNTICCRWKVLLTPLW